MPSDILQPGDWDQFERYAGTAAIDFPALIAQIVSLDPIQRRSALEVLYDWTDHAIGAIGRLGAVPFVLRFLVDCLRNNRLPETDKVLELVLHFAVGVTENAGCTRYYEGDPETLIRSVRREIEDGEEVFERYLESNDIEVRAYAAKAIGLSGGPGAAPILLKQLDQETDSRSIQGILSALGDLRALEALPVVMSRLDYPDLGIRVHAAGAACLIAPVIPQQALRILADVAVLGVQLDLTAVNPNLDENQFVNLDLQLRQCAIQTFEKLGEEGKDLAVAHWISEMARLSNDEIIMYVDFVLSLTIPSARERNRIPNFQFSSRQRKVLRAVVNCSAYWDTTTMLTWMRKPHEERKRFENLSNCDSRMLAEDLGLPSTRESLSRFLDTLM